MLLCQLFFYGLLFGYGGNSKGDKEAVVHENDSHGGTDYVCNHGSGVESVPVIILAVSLVNVIQTKLSLSENIVVNRHNRNHRCRSSTEYIQNHIHTANIPGLDSNRNSSEDKATGLKLQMLRKQTHDNINRRNRF